MEKDQMERIAEEHAAMQAEIEDLLVQLDAVGRTIARMQIDIDAAQDVLGKIRGLVQARESESTFDAVARLHLRAEQREESMVVVAEMAVRDKDRPSGPAPDLSWLKTFAEADGEAKASNGVLWREVPCEYMGEVIRHKRVLARMSLDDVYRVIGMPVIRLSALERNMEKATQDEIRALIDAIPDLSAYDMANPARVMRKMSNLPVQP